MENQSFWLRDGRANEVDYWVFDYPASKELAVREVVKRLVKRSEQSYREYQLVEYDIYDYIIDTLQKEGYLEATYMLEESAGMHVVIDSVFELLQFNERDNWFIKHVQEHTPDNAIVLLTGIGKVYPLLRSHKILNNLSMAFRKVPVILFSQACTMNKNYGCLMNLRMIIIIGRSVWLGKQGGTKRYVDKRYVPQAY